MFSAGQVGGPSGTGKGPVVQGQEGDKPTERSSFEKKSLDVIFPKKPHELVTFAQIKDGDARGLQEAKKAGYTIKVGSENGYSCYAAPGTSSAGIRAIEKYVSALTFTAPPTPQEMKRGHAALKRILGEDGSPPPSPDARRFSDNPIIGRSDRAGAAAIEIIPLRGVEVALVPDTEAGRELAESSGHTENCGLAEDGRRVFADPSSKGDIKGLKAYLRLNR
jgi:hypothetical protein